MNADTVTLLRREARLAVSELFVVELLFDSSGVFSRRQRGRDVAVFGEVFCCATVLFIRIQQAFALFVGVARDARTARFFERHGGRGLDGANLGERAGAGDEGSGRGCGRERDGTDGDGADDPEQTP